MLCAMPTATHLCIYSLVYIHMCMHTEYPHSWLKDIQTHLRRLNRGVGEDRRLSGQERLLLLQRTWVAFSVTTSSYSQLPATPVPGSNTFPRESGTLPGFPRHLCSCEHACIALKKEGWTTLAACLGCYFVSFHVAEHHIPLRPHIAVCKWLWNYWIDIDGLIPVLRNTHLGKNSLKIFDDD